MIIRNATPSAPVACERLELTRFIKAGDIVAWGQAAAEPVELIARLFAQCRSIGALTAFSGISYATYADTPEPLPIRMISYAATGTNQARVAAGRMEIWPGAFSTLPAFLAERVDVLLLSVSPPDRNGAMSLGLSHEYLIPLLDRARIVIAEVNPHVPFTMGSRVLQPVECTALVSATTPPYELVPRPPSDAELRIAATIAGIIEDRSILQTGIGSLPDAILAALAGHKDLGFHSGLASEGLMHLLECGAVTNARKRHNTGVSIAGMALGTARFYRYLHENRAIEFRGTDETHNADLIASEDRFVAINAALEVDLTGQINAESVGGRYVGAVGGAGDFLRAAARSRGGLPIVALPATSRARDGQIRSHIVTKLDGPVSTARSDAGLIVTEFGIADLRGKTLSERRTAMIDVAAPQYREGLSSVLPK